MERKQHTNPNCRIIVGMNEETARSLEQENEYLKGKITAYEAVINTIIAAVFGAGLTAICLLLFY